MWAPILARRLLEPGQGGHRIRDEDMARIWWKAAVDEKEVSGRARVETRFHPRRCITAWWRGWLCPAPVARAMAGDVKSVAALRSDRQGRRRPVA
jgi:hypothetical protein